MLHETTLVAPLFMQKRIRIGTAIIAAIVLIIGSYVGIQNIKQTSIIQTFESSLEKMGGEKTGNDYCL